MLLSDDSLLHTSAEVFDEVSSAEDLSGEGTDVYRFHCMVFP